MRTGTVVTPSRSAGGANFAPARHTYLGYYGDRGIDVSQPVRLKFAYAAYYIASGRVVSEWVARGF